MKVYTSLREGISESGGIRRTYYDVPVKPTERHPWEEDVVNFSRLYESGLLDQFYKEGLKFPEWLDGCCDVRPVIRDGKIQTPRVGDDLVIGADENYNLGRIIEIWEFEVANSNCA